ncbi:MAG: hypothetical protein FWD98_05340 [Defluviitaleaceae bacterium]|nr:hypothetical protein [Defluviitaleaceae bacterium]
MFEIILILFITMALTEMVKSAQLLRRKLVPLFAVGCAVLVSAGYGWPNIVALPGLGAWPASVVSGVSVGLISCGLYSFAKSLLRLVPDARP